MTEFKQYTPEQEAKIAYLRSKNEASRKNKSSLKRLKEYLNQSTHNQIDEISEGTRVFVDKDSATIIGYVLEVKDGLYKISTPYGIMKDLERKYLRKRDYRDLSHVVIPDELKKISTGELLSELRVLTYGYDDYRPKFSEDEIRAELRNRPNIHKKRNKVVAQRYSK